MMGIKGLFLSKAEKLRQQALHDRIRYLRGTFPETFRIPTCNPHPNKTEELQREADLLQDARDLLEAQRTTTLPHAPTVPSHIVELPAAPTLPAGALPPRRAPAITTVVSNHLDLDLGILGLKTLHLYVCAVLGLGYLVVAQLGAIAVSALETLSAVLTDPAVVRGFTVVGLGAVVAAGAAVAHVNHSNNARRVAEVGIKARARVQARRAALEGGDAGRLMLEDSTGWPLPASAGLPRAQRELLREEARARG